MVTILPEEKNTWGGIGEKFGAGLVQGYTNRADETAIQKAITALGPNASGREIIDALTKTRTYNPDSKPKFIKSILGAEKFDELKRHSKAQEDIAKDRNKISAMGKQSPEDRKASYENFIARNYTPDESEAMTSPYVPDGVKQQIARTVEDENARGIRKKPEMVQQPSGQVVEESVQVNPDGTPQVEEVKTEVPAIKKVPVTRETPWPEIPQPPEMKGAERVKWRQNNQKFNSTELKDTRQKLQAEQDALLHYNRLSQLNDTGKVQNGLSRVLLDPETGEPYRNVQKIGGVNKETQQYMKTLNDFISQAKNFFGARVTNFDLVSFKARLPSLLNTEEGRRAIIEQMRLMTELQTLHDRELSDGLKHYGDNASYIDIVKATDDRITSREAQIINKINHLDTATKYMDIMVSNPKYKGMEMMFNPETNEFIAVRPGDVDAVKKKGYQSWKTPH